MKEKGREFCEIYTTIVKCNYSNTPNTYQLMSLIQLFAVLVDLLNHKKIDNNTFEITFFSKENKIVDYNSRILADVDFLKNIKNRGEQDYIPLVEIQKITTHKKWNLKSFFRSKKRKVEDSDSEQPEVQTYLHKIGAAYYAMNIPCCAINSRLWSERDVEMYYIFSDLFKLRFLLLFEKMLVQNKRRRISAERGLLHFIQKYTEFLKDGNRLKRLEEDTYRAFSITNRSQKRVEDKLLPDNIIIHWIVISESNESGSGMMLHKITNWIENYIEIYYPSRSYATLAHSIQKSWKELVSREKGDKMVDLKMKKRCENELKNEIGEEISSLI